MEALAQFTMNQILELKIIQDEFSDADQKTEDYLIKQIDNLYHQLHLMYDGKCKREHDEVEGKDYYIEKWYDEIKETDVLIFKHRTSGFVPRLSSKDDTQVFNWMDIYIIRYTEANGRKYVVDVTNNKEKWILENNSTRDEDQFEKLSDFDIERRTIKIYN